MSYTPWTDAEIALLCARYPQDGAVPLTAVLTRTRFSITTKARSLGLCCKTARSSTPAFDWTPERDGILRAEWPDVTAHRPGHTAQKLAQRLGCTVIQARDRAGRLMLRRTLINPGAWSEDEDTLLMDNAHLSLSRLRAKFKHAGFSRSEGALSQRRSRLGCVVHESGVAYSGQGLARLMGCSMTSVAGWIRRGWLKAAPRSNAVDPRTGGPGDRWLIYPKDVRAFICRYTAHLDLHRADKFWLVDLLAGGDKASPKPLPVLHQLRVGVAHEAASGYAEHEVWA